MGKKEVALSTSTLDLMGDPERGHQRLRDIALSAGWSKGRHCAATLDRALTFKIKKIQTGIFALDWMTHGGFPIDRITRMSGPKNSCKTTTMLKVLANSQGYCRMCKCPIVVSPATGKKDCACPNPRFMLEDARLFEDLSDADAEALLNGAAPKGARGSVKTRTGKHAKLVEVNRCDPMRAVLIEPEHKLDVEWAKKNGVDTQLVIVVGADWAESTIDTVEKLLYSTEVDLVLIDTLSMLVPADTIRKTMDEHPKVAEKANIIQRFLQKVIAAQYSGGLLNSTPVTLIVNSQIRTKGIGAYRTFLGVSDGNTMDHCTALDIALKERGYIWENKEYASYGKYEFTILKNHTGGSPGVTGEFKMWLDPNGPYKVGDTDDLGLVMGYGKKMGMIRHEGGRYKLTSRYTDEGFSTLKEVEKFLVDNHTVYLDLRRAVLEKIVDVRTPKKDEEKKGSKDGEQEDAE